MNYREKIEVIITVQDDQDANEVLPLIEEAGIENCTIMSALPLIIGYIAVTGSNDNRHAIYERVKNIDGVTGISSAVIHNVLNDA